MTADKDLSDAMSNGWRSCRWLLFAGTALLLSILPWTTIHWPSQDGPSHLAVAHVLLHYGDPGSPFPQYLAVHEGIRPSTLIYRLLTFLGARVGLEVAEKLLVSLAILSFPFAGYLFVRRTLPRRALAAFLLLPLATGWALAMGFLSYLLALSAGVLTLALGWDLPREGECGIPPLALRHGLAAIAFLVCVLFHPVSGVLTGLAFLLLEGPRLRQRAGWRSPLAILTPATLYLLASVSLDTLPSVTEKATDWAGPHKVLSGVVEYQIAYSLWELLPKGMVLAGLVVFGIRGIRTARLWGPTTESAVARLATTFAVLYAITPNVLQDWHYCSVRFLIFAVVVFPATLEIPQRLRSWLPIAGAGLGAAVFAIQVPAVRTFSDRMQEVLEAGADLPRGAKLIPMDFTYRGWYPLEMTQPLDHAWAQLVATREVVASQLFAAGKPRMGGEIFRTLSFLPGVLDLSTGSLPWSGAETVYDVVYRCRDSSSPRCAEAWSQRQSIFERVLDRYQYVLMLAPPEQAQHILTRRLELRRRVGIAWLYAVLPGSTQPAP